MSGYYYQVNQSSGPLPDPYPPYLLGSVEDGYYVPASGPLTGPQDAGNLYAWIDYSGSATQSGVWSDVTGAFQNPSGGLPLSYSSIHNNVWMEVFSVSQAFTNMQDLNIQFDFNHDQYMFGSIPDYLFDYSQFGYAAFGLLDLTMEEQSAYHRIEFNAPVVDLYSESFSNLDPSHNYAYFLDAFSGVQYESNDIVTIDMAGGGVFGLSADTSIYNVNAEANPVPIPSAIWLLGPGLIGLVGFRRKLKKT